MDDYFVSGDADAFSPEEFAEIKLCLETLLSVRAGTQPMDRNFGINADEIIGRPTEIAKNILSVEIIEKVREYEPRAEVDSIEYEDSAEGRLVPHIHFIKEEVE